MPEPKTSKAVVGAFVLIPKRFVLLFQKKFALSSNKAPEVPIKPIEPVVNAVVIVSVAVEPTKLIVPSNPFASLNTNEVTMLGDNST